MTASAPTAPPGNVWVGPLVVSPALAQRAWRMAGVAGGLSVAQRMLAAVAVGVVPLLLGYALGTGLHQPVVATGLFFLMLAGVRDDDAAAGIGAVALGFFTHAAVAITLSYNDGLGAAAAMPDGWAYWQAQEAWITTGTDPEYDPANWAPAHLHLLLGCIALGFVSFGLTPLMQGVYEVDLMNVYVGQLLAGSESWSTALLFGWHPWSVLRGLCYLVLIFEVASWSLARFTGRTLSTPARRRARWMVALTLFVADAVTKVALLDVVRDTLAANLI